MSDLHSKVSKNKRDRVLSRYDCKCIYCGRDVYNADHLLPLALCKWTGAPSRPLNSEDNLVAACYSCNVVKSSSVPKRSLVKSLGKDSLELYDTLKPYIDEYYSLIQSLLGRQDHKCYLCHRKILSDTCTIRRIDNAKPRCKDNACLLCTDCNIRNFIRHDRDSSRGRLT